MNHPIDTHPLTLCAMWHESQSRIMQSLARDARAERNQTYCHDMAGTHERWAKELRSAAKNYGGKSE